jgi:hypothetical protein
MQTDNAQPNDITDERKYKLLAGLTDRQRVIMSTLIIRSRKGLWTRYSDFEDIKTPEKRMSELTKMPQLGIRSRHIAGSDLKMEFCL